MRKAEECRKTKETDIKLTFEVDGGGFTRLDAGIGFFEHLLDGFARHPGSGRYIGRFHNTGDAAGVYSKGGGVPMRATAADMRTYCHNKGSQWYMLDLASWAAIQMLYLVEFADWD